MLRAHDPQNTWNFVTQKLICNFCGGIYQWYLILYCVGKYVLFMLVYQLYEAPKGLYRNFKCTDFINCMICILLSKYVSNDIIQLFMYCANM